MKRMKRLSRSVIPAVIAGTIAATSCGRAIQQSGGGGAPGALRSQSPASSTQTAAKRAPNVADLRFMSGMIPHHAQAVLIAGWAPTHGARSDVRILCERIVVGQRDEINLMQTWLRDRGQPVPDAKATHMKMMMDGMEHDILMPGMLTDAELAQLDKARGFEFDRLFLAAMIRHHQGAITMVDQLFGASGAGQDEVVFRFASDVYADQTTEIDRMQKMLATIPAGGPGQ
jgi:uncharacterized protein (DUF305 family)